MPATSDSIASLPPLQRRMAEAWLTRFEENWHDQKLRECMRALPAQSSLRRPLLLSMIKRDLAHHWDQGRKTGVETYLKEYPELGSADEVPVELIASEYNIRQKYGGADLAEFAERFPSRIDDLYVVLKPSLFDGGPQSEPPPADTSVAEHRRKLLGTPAGAEAADPVSQRRLKLLRSSVDEEVGPPPQHAEEPPAGASGAPGDVDIFLPPEPARTEPTRKIDVSPAQMVWLDVDTVREPRAAPATLPGSRHGAGAAPMPPPVLGRYAIERRLGSSGLGSLYEAVDSGLGRRVALKVPHFAGPGVEQEQARFHREARAAAGLHHPLLCPVLDAGQCEGFDFLAMPFVEGDPLQDLLKQRPIWPPRQAIDLALKLATAMDAAHRQGVVHRDLKPSNILMTPSETPVIVGFGQSARPAHSQRTANAVYVAPEQITGPPDAAGPRSDIFSLGVILYQLLTGLQPPAAGPKTQRLFPPDLDPKLQEICRKAMAYAPDDRYTTMRDLANDLTEFRQTLRPSDQGSRLSLGGSAGRRNQAQSAATPGQPPTLSPGGRGSATFNQMQQLRNMSSSALRSSSAPRAGTQGRRLPRKWLILGGVALLALVAAIFVLSGGNNEPDGGTPNNTQGAGGVQPEDPAAKIVTETPDDLIKAMQTGNIPDRAAAIEKIKLRKDPEMLDALEQYIAASPWSEDADPKGEMRVSALTALQSIEPNKGPVALKRAAKSEDYRLRIWAYREIADRIVADSAPVLQGPLLAGLKDPNPDVRRVVAGAIKHQTLNDPAVIQALVARVADDVWGEPNTSPPNNFIHNPRADGGKNAALDALEELAPARVAEALRGAAASRNLDVKKWAERQRKNRED